jgi:hypothetical protein
VPIKVYDRTISVMKSAVRKARLGHSDELWAIKRLDAEARRLERYASGPSFKAFVQDEMAASHSYGGRSVFGEERPALTTAKARSG